VKKKKVTLPFNLKNERLTSVLQSRPGVIISNWICQGMIYMNKYERLYRLTLEISLIGIVFWAAAHLIDYYKALLVSFLMVHTIFWTFNGHIYVLMRYLTERNNDPARFIAYIEGINERLQGKDFLRGAVAFGSLSKDKFTASSDFDVRFLRKPGLVNSLQAFNHCALERARAFVQAFPLDIYVFDVEELSQKIRADEPPVVMMDPEGIFENRGKIAFRDFCDRFYKTFVLSKETIRSYS
jgi:hypothetical protein